jgi:DNA-binding FrmR family transcriptional regulator
MAITRVGYAGTAREGAELERENTPRLLNRLSRIEGQVRGVSRMVEEGRYCIDILTQVQAARAALARVETEMLKDHLSHCIEGAIVSGDKAEQRRKSAELIHLLERATR